MQAFVRHKGVVAPLDRANVDTDLIVPKQFLRSVERTGYGGFLFDSLRYLDEGELGMDCSKRPRNSDFVLNQPRYQKATILLARENFGCGSSREHAVWALQQAGFRCVIAPSFADIFRVNAGRNGLLALALDSVSVDKLFEAVRATPGYALEVDLQECALTAPDGAVSSFDIDPGLRLRLMRGLDEIGYCLAEEAEFIRAFEKRGKKRAPWLFSNPHMQT